MNYEVFVTNEAEVDFDNIYDYILSHFSLEIVQQVITRLENVFNLLSKKPQNGLYLKELRAMSTKEFREVNINPYRILYYIEGKSVYVVLIADGRCNMQRALEGRLC